ncbi:TULIP family P47-like protein [Bacillus cereus group sp. BceL062]|uniref:TULIP family P47-like protein n=1 Tax=Bacillus cereus group sp. BceL062 TaxID=3445166 RepID=UPI003F2809C5
MTVTDTLGWDTVFALPISKVNEVIVSPKTFESSFKDCKSKHIEGEFGKWQIVKGGDSSSVYLDIPINSVKGYEEYLSNFSGEKFSLKVAVELDFISQKVGDGSSKLSLMVKTKAEENSNPIVFLVNVNTNEHTVIKCESGDFDTPNALDIIAGFIIEWLIENINKFNHIFATVNLNEKINQDEAWAWCKPTDVKYAYTDSEINDGLLGILCMTGGRKTSIQQDPRIDPNIIPQGSTSGFIISQERILNDLVLPLLPKDFTGSTIEDYEVINKRDPSTGKYQYTLELKEGKSIKLKPIQHLLKDYIPYMKNLCITIEDNQLIFETYTETNVEMGMTAWCRTKHQYNIKLGKNQYGKQNLDFEEIGKGTVLHGVTETSDTKNRETILIVVGIVAELVLTIFTGGFAAVIAGIIILILTGVAANEGKDLISIEHQDTSPSIDLAFFNITNPIKWSDADIYTLNTVALAGPLQLGGIPHF